MEFSFSTDFLQQIVLLFIGVVATGIMGLIGYYVRQYFKARADCFRKMQEELQKQDRRGIRQSRAIIAMAQRDDEITARLHPGEPRPDSASEVEKLLQDERGEL